jgi:hypothetical protein
MGVISLVTEMFLLISCAAALKVFTGYHPKDISKTSVLLESEARAREFHKKEKDSRNYTAVNSVTFVNDNIAISRTNSHDSEKSLSSR